MSSVVNVKVEEKVSTVTLVVLCSLLRNDPFIGGSSV